MLNDVNGKIKGYLFGILDYFTYICKHEIRYTR